MDVLTDEVLGMAVRKGLEKAARAHLKPWESLQVTLPMVIDGKEVKAEISLRVEVV